MIQKIAISHFRCFRETEIDGFTRVNLIGGLNNAGKTAFLEALLLNGSPTLDTLLLLRQQRGESDLYAKEFPANTWDYLFYGQDKDKTIKLTTDWGKELNSVVTIDCYGKNEDISKLKYKLLGYDLGKGKNYAFLRFVANKKTTLSAILSDEIGIYEHEIFYGDNSNYSSSRIFNINLIPAQSKQSGAELAKAFSKAARINKTHLVKKALQLVDSTISEINVSVFNGINLMLSREGENAMPVSMFGDAINKIVHIILTVINNNSSILLIDEIENGIHYTVQRQFWKYLFTLAKEFDIQIFATTHSLEMIQAFAEVASLNHKEDAAYFEFIRHIKTQEIDANRHKIDTLKYELNNHLTIRGE